MWEIQDKHSTNRNIKFGIEEDEKPISNRRFLQLLSESELFREFYNDFLNRLPFEAFFWENKPLTAQNLKNDYECNIISSDFLAGRSPDEQTFSHYFDDTEPVVTFPNLGKDATLIVPCPQNEKSCYTHIGNFVRKADENQIDAFWKITGNETLQSIGSKPIWLSTSGLGVFWLHARIDNFPKYYQTEEYKSF